MGVQPFAKGPDGGRDARFSGTAEQHPSRAAPWTGETIIQAKHTNAYNCTFSDSDFYSATSATATLIQEMPRIKNLRARKELDNYILFANRRMAGNAESTIRKHLSKECLIPESSIHLSGIEGIELLLKTFDDIPAKANLDPIDGPLIITPDDLAEVVSALADRTATVSEAIDDPPANRENYDLKNAANNMTPAYALAQRRNYLKDTAQIRSFLSSPENIELLRKYESVVDEIELRIIAHRKEHQTFDKVMNYITDLLFARDPILAKHKRLTRTVIFYMYWNCDIGQIDNATSN